MLRLVLENGVVAFEGERPTKIDATGREVADMDAPLVSGVLTFADPASQVHISIPLDANGLRQVQRMLEGKPIVETARIIDPRGNGGSPV